MNSFRNVLAVMAVVVFYQNIHGYLNVRHGVGVPWHWVVALIILSLPMLFSQVMTTDFLREPIVMWCFGYAWVTMVWFLFGSQSDMAWQEVRTRGLAIIEILSFLAIFMNSRANLFARLTIVIAVHVGIAINVYELFNPMSFSEVMGRSAGLYMNANASAAALVLGMILCITVLPTWYRGGFILLVGIGVCVTYSRAGLIGWLIAVGGLMAGRFIEATHVVRMGFIALFLVGLVLLPNADQILATLEGAGSLTTGTQQRLEWIMDPLGVDDASSSARKAVAQEAWERVAEQPFLGGGTGAVHKGLDIPPHNQYLSHMMDHGFLGAMLMPLLMVALLWRAEGESRWVGFIFSCAVLWYCFFSHMMLNSPHFLLLFSLVAALASTRVLPTGQVNQGRRTSNSDRGGDLTNVLVHS
jgi:hypothetical protein